MLVVFTCKVHADVVMFGDLAGRFLRIMGENELPPGILRGERIKEAADKLRAWLDELPVEPEPDEGNSKNAVDDADAKERRNRVGLKIRALPLLELMDASYRKECDVIWR
jgi:hypothetical protein